ncbi:unnamed protein product, partial [Porites evermanni]
SKKRNPTDSFGDENDEPSLGGVLHLSPEKLTNNEPFLNQENHWISGELVGIIAEGQGCSSRSDSTKCCKMKGHYPSDFVTN